MILIADENVQRTVIDILRQKGHDVRSIAEMGPGLADEAVLETTNREGGILLTYDRDFGELVFRQNRLVEGVLLVRLADLSPARIADIV